MADFDRESMLDMFIYEMSQLLEQLEQHIIKGESGYSMADINEIFRIMHTIKGSAAMMMFDSISGTAHSIEDLFFYLREENPQNLDYSRLTDHVLEGMDFIKGELGKIQNSQNPDGDGTDIIRRIKAFLDEIKGKPPAPENTPQDAKAKDKPASEGTTGSSGGKYRYRAKIYFEDGCEMENIRAYTLVHNLGGKVSDLSHVPHDIIDEEAIPIIRKNGFLMEFSSDLTYNEMSDLLSATVYLREVIFEEILPDAPATDVVETPTATDLSDIPTLQYEAIIHFVEEAGMENARAYAVVHNMEKIFENIKHEPVDLIDEASNDIIKANGFKLSFDTNLDYDDTYDTLSKVSYLKSLELNLMTKEELNPVMQQETQTAVTQASEMEVEPIKTAPVAVDPNVQQSAAKKTPTQHMISVSVSKLDQLLNLMGELVIAEAMVTQNPELEDLELESFHRETRQLRKIINDVQDNVMSMRMVPLSTTFFKMHRIVRDMCKQLNKDVQLEISGEETEVDKNIIEHISDPLMHIIRNSVDHGIEMPNKRVQLGKPEKGTVYLEAKNSGGDVLIIVRDDGAGLNRDKILARAKANGLLRKPENEYTEKEIHQFIFLPGFSTNESVTSYSGRGVGMDVVSTNLEIVGGSALVESTQGEGSVFTLKIPLTLAIIEGMTIMMGGAKYTIPIISIQQSFKAKKENVFTDPSGNEMITVRGEVYNVVRLYEFFGIDSKVTDIEEGIMIMLENGDQTVCLFADELIGEQQVVVKSMPKYIKKIRGISGCTLLGNGDISLIIDVAGFFDK